MGLDGQCHANGVSDAPALNIASATAGYPLKSLWCVGVFCPRGVRGGEVEETRIGYRQLFFPSFFCCSQQGGGLVSCIMEKKDGEKHVSRFKSAREGGGIIILDCGNEKREHGGWYTKKQKKKWTM